MQLQEWVNCNKALKEDEQGMDMDNEPIKHQEMIEEEIERSLETIDGELEMRKEMREGEETRGGEAGPETEEGAGGDALDPGSGSGLGQCRHMWWRWRAGPSSRRRRKKCWRRSLRGGTHLRSGRRTTPSMHRSGRAFGRGDTRSFSHKEEIRTTTTSKQSGFHIGQSMFQIYLTLRYWTRRMIC